MKHHDFFSLQNQKDGDGDNCKNSNIGNIELCTCSVSINLSGKLFSEDKNNLLQMKEIYQKYIFSPKFELFAERPIADIAIHIRSGDIFKNNIHPYYAQPCLNFYTLLCDTNLRINIVFENELNPVVRLLKNYCQLNSLDKVCFFSNHVYEDIYILSKAKKIVFSNGTFCISPFVMSKTITHVLIPHSVSRHGILLTGENIFPVSFPNYIHNWKNNSEQLEKMNKYQLVDTTKKVMNDFIKQ
jgi:hypothetical protein